MKKLVPVCLIPVVLLAAWLFSQSPAAHVKRTTHTEASTGSRTGAPVSNISGPVQISRPNGESRQTGWPLGNTAPLIPDHVQFVLQSPAVFPRWEFITGLTEQDKELLVKLYRQTTNVLDRLAITWALAYVGDEEVVELFKESLLHQFAGRKLTVGFPDKTDEENVLFDTVRALGLLATKYDSAYSFLKQGTDPWFWKANVAWSSNRGRDTVGILTGESIAAMGLSDKPETVNVINGLKSMDLINRTGADDRKARNFAGAVVQAAFYYDVIQRHGMDCFRKNFVGEERGRLWEEWKSSDTGKQWQEWYNSTRRSAL